MSQEPPPTPPQQELSPIAQPFPGSLTPGWNDPPSISYSPQPIGAAGRTKLNKRVPFPLQPNANTTKPTAVVQPSLAPTPNNPSNVAVVYPIQYASQGMPPHATRVPTLPGSGESPSTLIGDNIHTTSPPLPTMPTTTTTSCVPTMSVPAVPRHGGNISTDDAACSVTSSAPAIQHL